MVPGEIKPAKSEITINEGRDTVTLKVANTGDRAVQVGSHFHFFEVNKALKLEREGCSIINFLMLVKQSCLKKKMNKRF